MVPKKTKSKRKTLHLKHKIMRKTLERQRKLRKMDRKMAKEGKQKHKPRDPGIPNNWPFKEELLLEAKRFKEQEAERIAEEKKRKREERSRLAKEANHPTGQPIFVATNLDQKSEFEKLVDDCDVLVETLDARDPIGCRSQQLEKLVLSKGKTLLFVLTKPDLIPQSNLLKWLNLLRPKMPIFVFKNMLPPTKNFGVMGVGYISNRQSIGDVNFLQVLKSLRPKDSTPFHVGLFGYYNSGKKQFLDSMNMLAYVKDLEMNGYHYLQLEDNIYINKNFYVSVDTSLGLPSYAVPRICHIVQEIKLQSCESLLSTYIKDSNKDIFSYHYNIPRFSNLEELCEYIYDKQGRGRNSTLPKDKICRQILRDIYINKIPSYSLPFDQLPEDEVLEGCKSTLEKIDRVSIYQKEDENIKEIVSKKYKYIINDCYISGAWVQSLKQAENQVIQDIQNDEDDQVEDSDVDLLNSDDNEDEDEDEDMDDSEEIEDDNYNFETDF